MGSRASDADAHAARENGNEAMDGPDDADAARQNGNPAMDMPDDAMLFHPYKKWIRELWRNRHQLRKLMKPRTRIGHLPETSSIPDQDLEVAQSLVRLLPIVEDRKKYSPPSPTNVKNAKKGKKNMNVKKHMKGKKAKKQINGKKDKKQRSVIH